MRLFTTRASLLAAAAAATMLLAACSSNGSGGGAKSTSGGTKGAQASSGANDISPVAYADVKDGGTLRWPIESFPTNFNRDEIDGNESGTVDVIMSMLPTVWHFDAGGQAFLNKDVVDKADQTSTSPQTIQYHINPKAVWSDGTPITWKDFDGIAKAESGKDKSFKIAGATGYENIKSVSKGATDQDVTVVFGTPFADWKALFDYLLPASLTQSATSFNTAWASGPTVSGGPFIVDKIDKTQKTITVKRNSKWWGQAPKLESIQYIVIDPGAQGKAYQGGQVDFVDIGSDAPTYVTVKSVAGTTIHKAGGPNYRHIDLTKRGALADVKVRQAVMLSLDRQGDAKALLSPLDWPAEVLDSHIWMNNQAQYKATCGGFCNRDVAKAKSLLESAGWKLGSDGIYAKAGKPLSLDFVIPAGVTSSENESQLQQKALKESGIRVNIKTVPGDPFFPDYIEKGAFDLTIYSYIGTQFPISSAKSNYTSDGAGNFGKIGDPAIDALYNQAVKELDPEKAKALTYQIDQKLWEIGNSATLYQRPDLVGTKTGLVNLGAFGFADKDYTIMGFK